MLKLRQSVEESEKAVEHFREKHGLLQGEQYTLLAEEISDLNALLTEARIERTQAQADASQARRLSSSVAGFGSADQVLGSDLIQALREQEAELGRKEAELSQEYGPRHPIMINVRAEQERLQQKVEAEVSKIYANLKNKLEVAQRREGAISKDLQKLKDQSAEANSAMIGLRMLEREAEANRVMLDKFQTSFMETSAQEHMESLIPIARIISPAAIPQTHSFPKRKLFVAGGFISSVLISLVLVFVFEQLDPSFRGAEQVERALRVPVLASVPMVPGFLAKGGSSNYILKNPSSAFAESIRTIYIRIMLTSSDPPPRTIMLVSSETEEGKSAIALSLAQVRQNAGQNVVIVDTDFRRSTIAGNLGLQEEPGLMDFLAGKTDLESVLQIEPESGLHVIAAGNYVAAGSDLLASENMELLLDRLRESYDLVILDAAPILTLSDPRVLSRMADKTILVVRWGKTPRKVVNHTVNALTDAGGQIAGIALSRVNPKKYAGYGYGDSSHYYGKATKYYVG
jgi:capsular exopolysaccharide synthesis family protein